MFDRIVAIEPVGLNRDATGCLQVLGKQMVMYDDRPDGEEERGRTVGAFLQCFIHEANFGHSVQSVCPSFREGYRQFGNLWHERKLPGRKKKFPAGQFSLLYM